jgi:hypothetical protein
MQWFGSASFAAINVTLTPTSDNVRGQISFTGPERARQLLRYHTSEQNRMLFDQWGLVQIPIAILVLLLMLFATNGNKLVMVLSAAMLVSSGVLYWIIGPQASLASRAMAFTSADDNVLERPVFWGQHQAYVMLDLTKIGLGVLLALVALRGAKPIGRSLTEPSPQEPEVKKRRRKRVPMGEFPKNVEAPASETSE